MTECKTVVITGAAGGIGSAMVRVFAEAGYSVIGTDRALKAPEALPLAHYIQADLERTVNDAAYAGQVFEQIRAWLPMGRLDALINNAAVQILGGVDRLTVSDWQMTLNVNLVAPFLWVQALLPELERANGSVVNVSSIHAKQTKSNFVAYATSKAALSGMTRAMAVDLGGRVRVNAIEPAAIATDMLRAGFAGKDELFSKLEQCHPQGRIGDPVEVGQCALALVDGLGRFVHGACLSIDGGISDRLFDPSW